MNFKFPTIIKPGEIGSSVITKSDDITVIGADLIPAQCKNYETFKGFPDVLQPNDCKTTDSLVVALVRVIFTDGSEWVSRSNSPPR